MFKGYLVDKAVLANDVHFAEGCHLCHQGHEEARDKAAAHEGLVKRPSDDLEICGNCHGDIAGNYKNALHYTSAGQKNGILKRFSDDEKKLFEQKVFETSCRSCHASCGDCHVKSPVISGVNAGLIQGHRFVKRDEGKTCALCHGGRVYPEFTGDYGGSPDVHYQKGMLCLDCHQKSELHGDGKAYASRMELKERPGCLNCHPAGQEKSVKSTSAHTQHKERVSCVACHASAQYRNCYDCHLGKGATAKPGFILGLNPKNNGEVTTLRLIPTVRDTFETAGIKMEFYDDLPNYWATSPHNLKKRTERTRSCEVCHEEKSGFLSVESLIKDGSKANENLVFTPKQPTK